MTGSPEDYAEKLERMYLMLKEGHTLQEVGETVGLTRERVRQLRGYFAKYGAKFPRDSRCVRRELMKGIIAKYENIPPTIAEEGKQAKLELLEKIMHLAMQGVSRPKIAEELGISWPMVSHYCIKFQELGAKLPTGKNITELIGQVVAEENNKRSENG